MILAPEGSKSGTLRIPAAQERDAGLYTCRAVNELGDASAETQLVVGREYAFGPSTPNSPSPTSSKETDICSPDCCFGEPEGAGAGVSSCWVAKLCGHGFTFRKGPQYPRLVRNSSRQAN